MSDEYIYKKVVETWGEESQLNQVVEEMGEESHGRFSKLRIVEIPDDIDFEIEEYDGMETVSERHQTWG